MTRRGCLVVANPIAGNTEEESVGAACAVLGRALDVEVVETTGEAELDATLDNLGERTLVVAGGDGTLHAAVERLWLRGRLAEVAVGLLPLGTGNDLARAIDLPLEPVDAARVVLDGEPRPLDLLVNDAGGVVVNAAHAGLGAEAAERSEWLKERVGMAGYRFGALVAAVREGGWDVRVEVDGRPLVDGERVLLAGVGNGVSIGGGTPLFPRARVDDGLLDVVVSTATGPAARVAFAAALRTGDHVERDDVATATGTTVRISGEPIRHDADGEVTAELADRTYHVVPAAWRVLCPS